MPVDAAVIADKVQRVLAAVPAEQACDPGYVAHTIRAEAGGIMSDVEVLSVLRKLRHDSVGVGPLEQVLSLPGVTDVLVNGTQGVWFDRGRGLEPADIGFASEQEVRQLATRLLVSAGRRLDDTQCFADGQLSRDDGSSVRVHAILSPPAQGGTCISLRVLRHAVTSLETLCERGTMSEPTKACLQQLVAARRSFLVIGGTGSGKTTLLAALLGEVSHRQRIICIEDTAELRPNHPHILGLVSRGTNTEGKGAITMADLLKQSLRMRPDRIVVGEIRGAEVIDLLAALNTGHDGCAGTVHANSLLEVPARLEALAARGNMGRDQLMSQLAAAKPVVLAMRRQADGRRVLHQIGVLSGIPTAVTVLWDVETMAQPNIDWAAVQQ